MPIITANVTSSTAAVYTSTGNTGVTFVSICNYTASNVTANVFVVPSGGSAGNLNLVLSAIGLTANDTYQLYAGSEKLVLSNGDSIQVNASANNSVATVTSFASF